MENKINVAELLKDCPKGMELYSPLCGKCVFDRLNMGTIICKKQNTQEITFTSEGYYMLPIFDDCECLIFPSKDQRDWSKFKRPFKDGDIVSVTMCPEGTWIGIFKQYEKTSFESHCSLNAIGEFREKGYKNHSLTGIQIATEEEKQKLFDAIKANGYKWNEETKTLEKLIEPKFKVGDKIKNKDTVLTIITVEKNSYIVEDNPDNFGILMFSQQDKWELNNGHKFKVGDRIKKKGLDNVYTIEITDVTPRIYTFRGGDFQYVEIIDRDYELVIDEPKFKVGDRITDGKKIATIVRIYKNFYDVSFDSRIGSFTIDLQDEWELLPNKFDITTLKPFDKVLARCSSLEKWRIQLFEKFDKTYQHPFICMGCNKYNQCIPYEGNEHLLDTKDDCDEYFKSWKMD